MLTSLYLGIDFGTSGARAIAIDDQGIIQAQARQPFNSSSTPPTSHLQCSISPLALLWQQTLWELMEQLPPEVRQAIRAIALNGTSATVLFCDEQGLPLDDPILYNDGRAVVVLDQVKAIAPANHTVVSATSSFAKLLWWNEQQMALASPLQSPIYLLHQADWLSFLLHGQLGITDYHNALKLGYDVGELRYPDWMPSLPPVVLPMVVEPGEPIAPITSAIAKQFHLAPDCWVCAGTTDSIAAFLASGARSPGEAVTSLGSTLVLKLLSRTRVDDAHYGIYSHRLGEQWLVGGASNTGGAVLRQFFSAEELEVLSQQIVPNQDSCLDYYPLLQPGERFPVNDPTFPPRIEPRPSSPVAFLHGLLEGMTRIEARGYRLLQDLGATPLQQVYTAGGGAHNAAWTALRSRYLQVPVFSAAQIEAAYGTAQLARQGCHR